MTITITPNPECKACHGNGTLRAGSVPYGSTWVSLPDDYCDCVIEQLPDDDADYDIELRLADEVLRRWEADAEAEAAFWAGVEQDEADCRARAEGENHVND